MKSKNLIATLASGAVVAASTLVAFTSTAVAGKEHAQAKVGEPAPAFTLNDYNGKAVTLADFTAAKEIVVLEWWNPGCPFVVKHHEKSTTMKDTAAKFADKGVVWLAINSSAEGKEGYGTEKEFVEKWKVTYPCLVDANGAVGHSYGATNTPHMFIIDGTGVLRYTGAIDSDPGAEPGADKSKITNYVDQALTQILAGETVTMPETKAYGCSVKYAKPKAN